MDTTQLLLSTAVTITTVLLIIVSVQLISLLKQLKRDHGKEVVPTIKNPEVKKEKHLKKRVNLTTLLEKMKNQISHPQSAKKKFFKSS
ncbi:MAG: hypothetical protein WC744_03980 [Patescibacteria group bacterium]|jgi:hypothetical protein